MNCPNCAKEYPKGSAECPACGIVFEKWRRKQLRDTAPAQPAAPVVSHSGGGGGFFKAIFVYLILPAALLAGAAYGWRWQTIQKRAAAKAAAEAEELAQKEKHLNTPQIQLQLQVRGNDICFAGYVRNLSARAYTSIQLQVRFHGDKRGLEDPPPVEVGPLPAGQDKRLDDVVTPATPALLEALGSYGGAATHYTIDVVAFETEKD
ncbi:MAG: hypothetical protein A2X36_08390 [Elusimicrobia bacterium GWA2_69_24]|nr:MAG: hypothetical protein A2X36_08390 [Elusimicrobia bacterium GWA2_69_24]HBL15385.1 hypothetical protein [Elusimicrobiota bacterium]